MKGSRAIGPILGLILLLACASCEKEITVELPDEPERLVVEGVIEPGLPPYILLTRTQGYFDPGDLDAISGLFVRDAVVMVDAGDGPITLEQICSASLTPAQQALIAELTGIQPTMLAEIDICLYSSLDPVLFGEVGRTYTLRIEAEGHVLTGSTTIPVPVPLDSIWFVRTPITTDNDSVGHLWGRIQDPDTMGNGYRWYDRRISTGLGQLPDPVFSSSANNTFDDRYFNGGLYDFNATGFRYPGDTVVVKFTSIGRAEYRFYRSFETNTNSTRDLFGTPMNAFSNVSGGLGIWVGRGVFLDTVICQ